jgi:DNA-binding GntR family transcriptional regulator
LSKLGRAAVEAVEMITARLPDPYEMDNLQVGSGEPLLVLTRMNRDISGVSVEYAVNRMVAGRTRPLVYRLRGKQA